MGKEGWRVNDCHRRRSPIRLAAMLLGLCLASQAGFTVWAGDAPAGPDYLLGPEDVLAISVWKDEHLTKEVVVRPDGMVSFPLVGDVPAAGRTVEDLRLDIAKRLARFIPSAHVSVALTKLLSYRIYVLGRVAKPGEYMIGHHTDVLQALSLAGGLTPFAAENDIKIMRRTSGDQLVFEFRYGDAKKGKDLKQNILLQRGDVVMVP